MQSVWAKPCRCVVIATHKKEVTRSNGSKYSCMTIKRPILDHPVCSEQEMILWLQARRLASRSLVQDSSQSTIIWIIKLVKMHCQSLILHMSQPRSK